MQRTDRLVACNQGDHGGGDRIRRGSLGGRDRAVPPDHDRSGQAQHLGQAGQRRLDTGVGRLRGQSPLAQCRHQARPSQGRRRVTAEPGTAPRHGRLVQGDRDHEHHDRQEREVEAQEPAAGFVDNEQHANQQEQAQSERQGPPEGPARDLRREEDTGREDDRRGEDHRQGHERHADPGIGRADHVEQADDPPGSSDRHGRERHPQLTAARTVRHGPAECVQQPPRSRQERGQSRGDPGPSEHRARNDAEDRVWLADRDLASLVQDSRQREQHVERVGERQRPNLATRWVPLGRDHEREVRRGRDDQRGRELLDGIGDLAHRHGGCQALDDHGAAPRNQRQAQEAEDPASRCTGPGQHGEPKPDAEDRGEAVGRDLQMLGCEHHERPPSPGARRARGRRSACRRRTPASAG